MLELSHLRWEQLAEAGRKPSVTEPALCRSWAAAGMFFGICLGVLGCERSVEKSPPEPEKSVVVTAPAVQPEPADPCLELARDLQAAVQLPGTPGLDLHRHEVLARARSVPVSFSRKPAGPHDASDLVKKYRSQLFNSERPVHDIQAILRKTRRQYELRRQIFLSEGYLYAETPLLALRLSQVLRLDHLFKEPMLEIQRGDKLLEVKWEEGRYWLPPEPSPDSSSRRGPHGILASLLLFDRVKLPEQTWSAPLHLDWRALQSSLGFEQAEILARTQDKWALRLNTREVSSTIVVSVDESGAPSLACEGVEPEQREALEKARREVLREQELMAPVLQAAHEMIRRRLPFDEPRTEEGQQDGLLRIHFRKAYRRYRSTYEFNGDEYYVFDGYGRPRLPQVCIDYITDAFDWGTGGKWPARGEKRLRVKGALNFASLGIENPRSVESLAEFATATPEWFDMLWLTKEEKVKFRHREKFFEALKNQANRYRPGDIVFIYGLRDDGKFHYHSFLIDEKDPLTGTPTVVLANAGPPQARSWEGEMHNAPDRAVVARLRVRAEVLERAQVQAKLHPGVPLEAPARSEEESSEK